jgi:hypothetical protein
MWAKPWANCDMLGKKWGKAGRAGRGRVSPIYSASHAAKVFMVAPQISILMERVRIPLAALICPTSPTGQAHVSKPVPLVAPNACGQCSPLRSHECRNVHLSPPK